MNRILKILITVCISVLSCGLPNFIHLEEPYVNSVSPLINLEGEYTNNPNNDKNYFIGHHLYYKIYTSELALDTGVRQIESTTLDATKYMISHGYTALQEPVTTIVSEEATVLHKMPLVAIPSAMRNSTFDVQLNFEEILMGDEKNYESYIKIDALNKTIPIARYVRQNRIDSKSNEFLVKNFCYKSFNKNDSDIPKGFKDHGSLYMAVFVVSLGADNNKSILKSEPTYIGKFQIDIDYFAD